MTTCILHEYGGDKIQMEVFMISLAYRLKIVREAKKLSLRALAKELNIHFSTLGSYEQGRRKPDVDTLKTLAEYFGVSEENKRATEAAR